LCILRRPVVTVSGYEAINSREYSDFGRVTEFKYGTFLGRGFTGDIPISNLNNFGK
jgi:hypothetical protein